MMAPNCRRVLMLFWMAVSVDGFAGFFRRRSSLPSTATELTEQDEQILFGGAAPPLVQRPKDKFGNILGNHNQPNPLDHAKDPLINKLRTVRETAESCPGLWLQIARACPDLRALYDAHLCDTKVDLTFAAFSDSIRRSASLFQKLGVTKGTNVAVFGENSARWLQVDQGIQRAGGASAVRGADAPLDELRYIYEHSDSANIVVLQGPKLLQKLAQDGGSLGLTNAAGSVKTVILMHREKKTDSEIAQLAASLKVEIQVFADLLEASSPATDDVLPKLTKDDLATIVYTSGTTGRPKGVMLTHGNLLHQIEHRLGPGMPYEESEPLPGETMVSLLPVWHITERTFELWMASRGCNVVYSSIRTFKKDLALHKPQWLVLVPRVLEKIAAGVQDKFSSGSAAVRVLSSFFTKIGQSRAKNRKIARNLVVADEAPGALEKLVARTKLALLAPLDAVGQKLVWSKVQDGFGGQLKTIISGGSALSGGLETFYETAGLPVLVGYGLTECAPLLSFRRSDANLVTGGCAGRACHETEVRVVDPAAGPGHERPSLPTGQAGLILGRGPQVMRGYYKNPEATAKAVDPYGWFDTGDLGRINPATGDLILTGRAKDTIVLSNGENIEPVPIEDAIVGESSWIDQIMLTGQDGKSLVAVTVLSPSELGNAGVLDPATATRLQEASDAVNDPKCTLEEYKAASAELNQAIVALRRNPQVQTTLASIFKTATANFRPWEKVSEYHLVLEPFAMVNGLLTQSYKVKRAEVVKRYASEL